MKNLNEAKTRLSAIKSLMISGPSEYVRPWYGQFLSRMNIIWTDKMPTAGVSITDKVNLYMNPDFLLSLNAIAAMELLEHEILHIVYLHPIRSKELGEDMDHNTHKIHNIATDAKINLNLNNLTESLQGSVTIDRLNKMLAEKKSPIRLTPEESSDSMYYKLRQFQEENQDGEGQGEGMGETVDDHGTWSESVSNEAMAKAAVSQVGNEATKAAGIGNTPSNVLTQLQALNKSLVNWKSELRRFFVNSLKFDFEKTRNRRNRRYGILQSGRKKKPNLHVAVIGDESGSMSDNAVSQIFAEIDIIFQCGVEITYISMDCEASKPITYKKGMKMNRTRSGGTYYTSGIETAKKLGVDAMILIGDFDSADTPTSPNVPFLWVGVDTKSPAPGSFGRTIYVETRE